VLIVIFFFLTKEDGDLQCLLTKNMIKACKSVIFSAVRSLIKIEPLDPQYRITGYSVGLAPTLIWAIREAKLHNRPFYSCLLMIWPLDASEAGVDLVLIQTSLLLLCKTSCSYAN